MKVMPKTPTRHAVVREIMNRQVKSTAEDDRVRIKKANKRLKAKRKAARLALVLPASLSGDPGIAAPDVIEQVYHIGINKQKEAKEAGLDPLTRHRRLIGRVCFDAVVLWSDIEAARINGMVSKRQARRLRKRLGEIASLIPDASNESELVAQYGVDMESGLHIAPDDMPQDPKEYLRVAKSLMREQRTALSELGGNLRQAAQRHLEKTQKREKKYRKKS